MRSDESIAQNAPGVLSGASPFGWHGFTHQPWVPHPRYCEGGGRIDGDGSPKQRICDFRSGARTGTGDLVTRGTTPTTRLRLVQRGRTSPEASRTQFRRTRHGLGPRGVALFIICAAAGIFGLAGRLSPSSTGLGTHAALGMPPCTFPMLTGYPCPTCGMTTSFAYFAHGRLVASFHAQPAGFALATALAALLFGACWTLVTGRAVLFDSERLSATTPVWKLWRGWFATPPRVTALVLGVMLFGWLYKIAAGLLVGMLPMKC